jgi:hypothetical protein
MPAPLAFGVRVLVHEDPADTTPGRELRKRAGVAQCTAGDFQGRVCESVEVCPAYAGLDRCRLISGRTSSITVSSAIALPKAASSRSSS